MKAILGLVLLLLLLPASASAESASEYGPWSASPGGSGTAAYDPDLEPWASPDLQERIAWACVDQRGKAISPSDREILSQVYLAGADVYDGKFSFGAGAVLGGASSSAPSNGGYREGSRGMQAFIRQEKALLRAGLWTPYSARGLMMKGREGGEKLYPAAKPGWQVFLGESGSPVTRKQGARISPLLQDNATTPLGLSEDLPEACGMQVGGLDQPTLQTQLMRPGDFLLDQALYVPGRLSAAAFEWIQPYAFSYTFWTPHTERSDLIWDVPEDCSRGADLSPQDRAEGCVRGEALGWTQSGYEDRGERSWFVAAAQLLQWLISGTYMLILFAAAIIYMFRGHRHRNLHVLRLLPRILLSVLLTLFAGFIIGGAISFSNLAVQTIFEWNTGRPLGSLNTILLQAGHISGGPDLVQRLIELGTSIMSVFYYLVFILFSLARQIALVGLVILAPLAAMTLIVPRWRVYFATYARIFAVVLIAPVSLAFVLKIGMSINPLVIDPENAYGEPEGVLGLLLLMVTFWIMYRLIRFFFEYARRGDQAIRPLLDAARERFSSLPSSTEVEVSSAALIPEAREAAATSALAAASAPATQERALPGARDEKSKDFNRIRDRAKSSGRRRLSAAGARRWKEGLRIYLQKCQEKAGRSLTRDEIEKATEKYKQRVGDLHQEDGTWYLEGESRPSS